ncbi:hypothetical protein Hanom_Chr01g00068601 [Helianthus anomalus]
MRFLLVVRRGMDIRSFNWCKYIIRCLDRTVEARTQKDYFLGPMLLLVAALIGDQKKSYKNKPRTAHLIEDITQDDIESLSIKLDTVRFEQMLEKEYELHPEQRYPLAKKEGDGKSVGTNSKKMAEEEVQAKEMEADEKYVSNKVKHNTKTDMVKRKKNVVKAASKTHGKPTKSGVPK